MRIHCIGQIHGLNVLKQNSADGLWFIIAIRNIGSKSNTESKQRIKTLSSGKGILALKSLNSSY